MATQNQTIINLNEKLTAAQAKIAELESENEMLRKGREASEYEELYRRAEAAERERDEARAALRDIRQAARENYLGSLNWIERTADRALVASDQAAARLDPSGFDPSRLERAIDGWYAEYCDPPKLSVFARMGLIKAVASPLTAAQVRQGWVQVPERYVTAVHEFLADWQKGDFSLSTLAALDVQSIIAAKEEWEEAL